MPLCKFFSYSTQALRRDAQIGSNVGLGNSQSKVRIGLDKVQIALFGSSTLQLSDTFLETSDMSMEEQIVKGDKAIIRFGELHDQVFIDKKHLTVLYRFDKIGGGLVKIFALPVGHQPIFGSKLEDVFLAFFIDCILLK